jgi:hypothetical protein
MTMIRISSTCFAALALLAVGCDKGGAPAASKDAPATASAATAPADKPAGDAGAAAAAAPADVAPEAAGLPAVPTEQDFEAKAKASVDAKNLEAEVAKMEKELGVK